LQQEQIQFSPSKPRPYVPLNQPRPWQLLDPVSQESIRSPLKFLLNTLTFNEILTSLSALCITLFTLTFFLPLPITFLSILRKANEVSSTSLENISSIVSVNYISSTTFTISGSSSLNKLAASLYSGVEYLLENLSAASMVR